MDKKGEWHIKQLLLITKNYPYDYGEEFIENEILELALIYDKITIFATDVKSTIINRKLPENVLAVPFVSPKYKLIPKIIRSMFTGNNMLSERDKINIKGNLKNRIFLYYFMAKSDMVYRKIKPYCNFSADERVTIYSYWLYDTAVAAVLLKQEQTCKVKAISRAHRYDLYEYSSGYGYLPLREYLLQNLDIVYTCSQNGTDYLNNLCPQYTDKIETAYLGVNDYGVNQTKKSDAFTIISCGYISPVKRVDKIAKSLAILNDGKKYKWVHFGGGEELDTIKQYADKHLGHITCEFKGNVKNSELLEYYKNSNADLFVNTSISEGLPVSIMEAQSFGIPVVATNVGGTSEIVIDGVTGYLLNTDFKVQKLADIIKSVSDMGVDDYNNLSANSRKNYLEKFNAKKNYQTFAKQIFEE